MPKQMQINWRKVLILNLILGLLIFLPFLPVSSYLRDVILLIHILLSFIGLTLVKGFIIFLLIVGVFLAYLIKTRRLNTFYVIFFSFIIVMTVSWWVILQGGIQRYERDYVIATSGKKLVNALIAYKKDHHHFPEQLSALQPDYLDRIPRRIFPSVSNWIYQKGDRAFTLRFEQLQTVYEGQTIEYNPTNQFDPSFQQEVPGFANWRYREEYHP